MSIEIKSWRDGKVLYTAKTAADVRQAVEGAVKAGANLRYADLRNANLWNANLWNADLRNADLRNADLGSANLGSANLRYADLRNADLGSANLWNANLWNANLWNADLGSADLRNADLRNANLRYAEGFAVERANDLLLLLDQVGKIRAYKLVDEQLRSPIQPNGKITYEIGSTIEVEADDDPNRQCGAGINLATLPWCLQNHQPGYRVLIMEFVANDIAAIPLGDGKFRVSKAKVVKEVDLEPIFEKERATEETEGAE